MNRGDLVTVVMVDSATAVRRARLGKRIGRIDSETMRRVERAPARFLGPE